MPQVNQVIAVAEEATADLDNVIIAKTEDLAALMSARDAIRGAPQFDIVNLVKDNWGKIISVATALGLPVLVADTGSFKGVLEAIFGV